KRHVGEGELRVEVSGLDVDQREPADRQVGVRSPGSAGAGDRVPGGGDAPKENQQDRQGLEKRASHAEKITATLETVNERAKTSPPRVTLDHYRHSARDARERRSDLHFTGVFHPP